VAITRIALSIILGAAHRVQVLGGGGGGGPAEGWLRPLPAISLTPGHPSQPPPGPCCAVAVYHGRFRWSAASCLSRCTFALGDTLASNGRQDQSGCTRRRMKLCLGVHRGEVWCVAPAHTHTRISFRANQCTLRTQVREGVSRTGASYFQGHEVPTSPTFTPEVSWAINPVEPKLQEVQNEELRLRHQLERHQSTDLNDVYAHFMRDTPLQVWRTLP